MKIAALCDFPFWQGNVGTFVRHASLCRSLSKICDLTVISTSTVHRKDRASVDRVPYRLIDRSVLKQIDAEIGPMTIPGVPAHRQMDVATITTFVAREKFDAVLTPYFNRNWMIEHLPPHIVQIIDTHDCQSQRTRSLMKHGIVPTFFMNTATEGALLSRYDIALAMSDEDRAEFAQMADMPVITAPFRLPPRDLAPMRHVYATPDLPVLLFIAAKSPVNDMTLDYLLREIMPLVDGPCTLLVIGNVTMPTGIDLPHVNIEDHQDVDDLVPLYARADLAINPTFAGGGVKTKTLEAMAFGVPVLTCDEGARGLRHLLPDDLVRNDKEQFAHQINTLLADEAHRKALARQVLDNMSTENAEGWLGRFADITRATITSKRDRMGIAS
jgi:hypothetical protein